MRCCVCLIVLSAVACTDGEQPSTSATTIDGIRLVGDWSKLPAHAQDAVRGRGLEGEWADVYQCIEDKSGGDPREVSVDGVPYRLGSFQSVPITYSSDNGQLGAIVGWTDDSVTLSAVGCNAPPPSGATRHAPDP